MYRGLKLFRDYSFLFELCGLVFPVTLFVLFVLLILHKATGQFLNGANIKLFKRDKL